MGKEGMRRDGREVEEEGGQQPTITWSTNISFTKPAEIE